MTEIPNVNVIDVKTGLVLRSQTVQVDDGKISAIQPALERDISNSECEELWAIPGLIDCHVHLFEEHKDSGEDSAGKYRGEGYDVDKFRALENLESALKAGITCVRDVGAFDGYNNRIRDFVHDNSEEYPYRIVSCGRHITRQDIKGAHFFDRGVIWDGNLDTLHKVIQEEVRQGADFIKIMNDDRIFDLNEIENIVKISSDLGKKVACHAFKKSTIEDAIRAGVGSVEHGLCFNDELIDIALSNGTVFCPTFIAAKDSVDCENDKRKAEVLEAALPDCTSAEFRNWLEFLCENLPKTFDSSVKVIAGTDAGIFPTDFCSLHRELIAYTQYGASILQAIQTATINAADALGIDEDVGTIEVGKSADIVFLGSDPLKNLEDSLANIVLVISRGKIVLDNRGN